jgi:hypothetical protein
MTMRLPMMAGCLLVPMQAALALSPTDCSQMTVANDRLACFDKLFPVEKKVADPKKEYRDITIDENARLDKSLKSICRDCSK